MSSLNPQQQRAVESTEGRVLVLAGAGSGKTTVLARRIAYLIQSVKCPPSSILGLTFTNKAAQEMRTRLSHFIGLQAAKEVHLSTFHSFCMQVLRKEIHHLGYTPHFTLYDEKDVKRVLTQLTRQILEHDGELPSLEKTLEKISYAKTRAVGLEAPLSTESSSWHDQFTHDIFQRLQICMRAYNAVDFDSILTLAVQLFEEHPLILESYQSRFRYLMIDEYQDTNPIQYRLANLLSAKHNNLCVVGDDDQSIYGWRGAEVKNILEFPADVVIKLEQNYRSTPLILKGANAVISHNQERHAKQLWSAKEEGELLSLFHAPTDMEEAQSVIQRIIWLNREKKIPWKEMAILYRSNVLSRSFETALLQATWEKEGKWVKGIPYQVFGGTEFYERSEVKDLFSYLRVVCNPHDQEALLRILNVPRRKLSEKALDLLTQVNRSQNIPLWQVLKEVDQNKNAFPLLAENLSTQAFSGIHSFVTLIEEAQGKFTAESLKSSVEWLLEEIGYKKFIEEEVKSGKMREFKWENILHLIDTLGRYEEEHAASTKQALLADYLAETMIDSSAFSYKEKNTQEDKLNVMTFHSAKGLEFEACFLIGLEDHIIPHEKSAALGGLEEERRLFYVAMTRAKKYLTLSMARKRKKMGKECACTPSRFLFEIPKELLKITSYQSNF